MSLDEYNKLTQIFIPSFALLITATMQFTMGYGEESIDFKFINNYKMDIE